MDALLPEPNHEYLLYGLLLLLLSPSDKRQDKQTDIERQPLLHAETPYEKAADVLAVLHSGKLPSQQQLDAMLKRLLRSGVTEIAPEEEQSALDESGKKVITDAREVVFVLLQVALEKNDECYKIACVLGETELDNRIQTTTVYKIYSINFAN